MLNHKVKLTTPLNETNCRVLYADTDAGGVVYNATYLRYFEMGRSEFMRQYVMPVSKFSEAGYVFPVVENYTRYKAPAIFDDLLLIKTSLEVISPLSLRFNNHILRADDGKFLVKGFTLHAVINSRGHLAKLPADIFSLLNSLI